MGKKKINSDWDIEQAQRMVELFRKPHLARSPRGRTDQVLSAALDWLRENPHLIQLPDWNQSLSYGQVSDYLQNVKPEWVLEFLRLEVFRLFLPSYHAVIAVMRVLAEIEFGLDPLMCLERWTDYKIEELSTTYLTSPWLKSGTVLANRYADHQLPIVRDSVRAFYLLLLASRCASAKRPIGDFTRWNATQHLVEAIPLLDSILERLSDSLELSPKAIKLSQDIRSTMKKKLNNLGTRLDAWIFYATVRSQPEIHSLILSGLRSPVRS